MPSRAERRSGPDRLRVVATWALGAVVPVLCVFALLGSLWAMPTFLPVGMGVPTAAVLLIGLSATTFGGVGALVAVRIPGNAIGWLLMVIGLSTAVTLAAIEWVALGLPGRPWAEWAVSWVATLPLLAGAYVLLLFPDGRLPAPRWWPALWLANLAVLTMMVGGMLTPYSPAVDGFTSPVGVAAVRGTILSESLLGFLLLYLALPACAAGFVSRYHRSAGAQRAQLKWFAWAASLVAAGSAIQGVTWVAARWTHVDVAALGLIVLVVCYTTVPVACGVAVLRYRLYDIDRVVSRTVSYLVLSGVVVGAYAAVVAAASGLLPGTPSQVVVATATLAAAAAFEPARRRVQHVVDRRFNRERFDARRLVDEFADRLRGTIDVSRTQRDLVEVVAHAVQPATVAVWRRQPPGAGGPT